MASIDHLRRVAITPSVDADAMILVAEAGWNQTEADWRLMGRCDGAIGLRDEDRGLAATALALPYPPGFGWISMVLVAGTHRRQGLATALLNDRIEWLCERGLVPVLDATEHGEPVYGRIGFAAGARFTRWQGESGRSELPRNEVREATADDHAWIAMLDRTVFGADRTAVLRDFLARPGSRCWVTSGQTGFAITRRGRIATQIGPLVADDETEATTLLRAALAGCEGTVFFDARDARATLNDFVRSAGLTRQRGFVRMSLGDVHDFDGDNRSMIIAGPEYG